MKTANSQLQALNTNLLQGKEWHFQNSVTNQIQEGELSELKYRQDRGTGLGLSVMFSDMHWCRYIVIQNLR